MRNTPETFHFSLGSDTEAERVIQILERAPRNQISQFIRKAILKFGTEHERECSIGGWFNPVTVLQAIHDERFDEQELRKLSSAMKMLANVCDNRLNGVMESYIEEAAKLDT